MASDFYESPNKLTAVEWKQYLDHDGSRVNK